MMNDRRLINSATLLALVMVCSLLLGNETVVGQQRERTSELVLDNGKLRVGFDPEGGTLSQLVSAADGFALLNAGSPENRSPWELIVEGSPSDVRVDASSASNFSGSQNGNRLELRWSGFKGLPAPFAVTAWVDLLPDSAMSSWRIDIEGTKGVRMKQVTFPRIAGLADLSDEELAVPDWMGALLKTPRKELESRPPDSRKFTWEYPGHMSMQFVALYNPGQLGLYFASDDTLGFAKTFTLAKDNNEDLVYGVDHFPAYDSTMSCYTPQYAMLVGSFTGDWYSAARMYKGWAEKQAWCRDSRLANGQVPVWVRNTAYWIWNRGRAANVLPPAAALGKRLGAPVSVLWHWWHGGSYDDSFPEYFPPRDGQRDFGEALRNAQDQNVNAIVYMNALKWGPSTASWVTEKAANYAAKDIDGQPLSHVYNIFTKKALTNMCEATDFWPRKYASLVDTAINRYGVNGVYMDQACLNRRCYDPTHGHPIGGGNYWVVNSARKDRLIREKLPAGGRHALTGEGVGENWLPYLDAFLALQVSKERYAGVHSWQTIPLFQAVYHEYGITFGNYSSLLTPPYDEMWPQEFAPDSTETPLPEAFNSQFLMEQARSFAWGMQPMVANYQPFLDTVRRAEVDYVERLARVRLAGLDYLLNGEYLRPPTMPIPIKEMAISRLSIYAGRTGNVTRFEHAYPSVYTSAWRAPSGNIAVAIASIQNEEYVVNFSFDVARQGLANAGEIYLHDEFGKRTLGNYVNGMANVAFALPPRGICYVEFVSK